VKLSRDRILEIVLVLLVLVLGGVLLQRELVAPVEPESHPIAIAIVEEAAEEEGGAWPPRGTDLHEALATSSAVSTIGASGVDAGTDAAEWDTGPPLPEPPPDTATFHVRQNEQDGIFFLEVVIGEASFEDELPMLVVLHGRGGSAQIPGGPFLGLTHPVRVIVPQATERLGEGYEWLPVYVGQGLVDRLSATMFEQSSRVARLLRRVAENRPTIGRVIVSGFSQGGLLTITLALYHDDLVGEAFPLACWLPPPLVPTYRRSDLYYPRIRSMHGMADPTIPLGPTEELFRTLVTLGFDATLVTFPGVEHAMSDDENALFHVWLEAAVCRAVGDRDCETTAEEAARAMMPIDDVALDAGPKEGDAGPPDDAAGSETDAATEAPDLGVSDRGAP
jgi:phospholipase/carboxylesterase